MAFIGNSLGNITTEVRTVDTMVGDGTTATLTLTKTPGSVNNVEVFFDGIFQTPGEDFTLSDNTLTFTTAPTTGINVVAISGNDSQVVFPDANSITTKKILDNTITSDKFVDIAVEKLSGTLSALDGSAVTGLILPDVVDVTTAASDPTRTTNKPVGSLAVNSTSGEMFMCTDAETDNNTWMNIGVGTGSVTYVPTFQGSIAGFIPGGDTMKSIEKLSFSAGQGSTAILHGDLTIFIQSGAGAQSLTHGYEMAGIIGNPSWAAIKTIQKFAFSSNVTATNVNNLVRATYYNNGCTDVINQKGFSCAGSLDGTNYWHDCASVEQYNFASNTVNGNFATISAGRNLGSSHSSSTHGFCAGGRAAPAAAVKFIDKFSFASGGASTNHGDLFMGQKVIAGGASSATEGFQFGGQYFSTVVLTEKFSFASNTTGSQWGDLWQHAGGNTSGVSGETFAYAQHGGGPNVSKYVYANDVVSVDWMDLAIARSTGGTSQY